MIITVNTKEEEIMIKQLCDITLKAGGIQNMEGVQKILASIAYPTETKE